MSRRFQFSLASSLASTGLLCVALVVGGWAVSFGWGSNAGLFLACAAGVVLATAVGVLANRWASFAIGAAIGIGTCLAYMFGLAFASGRF
jgi:hypothetical protein